MTPPPDPAPAETANRRVLSGMRSSNPRLHIGNYEGALRNWVDLQNEGYEMFCMVADWHALTTMYDRAGEVARNSLEVAKDFVAAGIDPNRSAVFIQSEVKEHAELHVLLSMITPLGWLERVPTFKEKVRDLAQNGNALARAVSHASNEIAAIKATARLIGEPVGEAATQISVAEEFELLMARIQDAVGAVTAEAVNFRAEIPADLYNLIVTTCVNFLEAGERAFRRKAQDQIDEFLAAREGWIKDLEPYKATFDASLRELVSLVYGLLGYPVLQTADILLYKPFAVPVGRDQAPHLEIGNDIAERFNRLYNREVFPRYRYLIPEDETKAKLPGIDMRKMSKSYDNCIYLTDTEEETAAKIKSAFTTPTKLRKTDPGIPEGCAVCQYLKVYSPNWQIQWAEDVAGERGCMQNKKECAEAVNAYLAPLRARRAELTDDDIRDILHHGAAKAREVAAATMQEVRSAMAEKSR